MNVWIVCMFEFEMLNLNGFVVFFVKIDFDVWFVVIFKFDDSSCCCSDSGWFVFVFVLVIFIVGSC